MHASNKGRTLLLITDRSYEIPQSSIKRYRTCSATENEAKSWFQSLADHHHLDAQLPQGCVPSFVSNEDNIQYRLFQLQQLISTATKKPEDDYVSNYKRSGVMSVIVSDDFSRSLQICYLHVKLCNLVSFCMCVYVCVCVPSSIYKLYSKLLLKKKSRKCSNMVSSLTKSWKQVEKEQKVGGEPGEGLTCAGSKVDSGHPEAERERLDIKDVHTQKTSSLKDDSEGESESALKIKRSTVTMYKKEADDANKINALSNKYSAVGNLKSRWQNWASEHTVNQKLNPFSEYFDYDYSMSLRLQKGQEGYGRPKEGTQTAERARRAEQHIHREIDDMCYVIRTMADPDLDGKTRVTFGQLFDRYVRISDKVVGILMRARKHGKVAFEGEMLWQGQDDGVIVTLLV
ncbi:Actin-binding Rho-activating protein [Collichthys lucidus]|uniref:Actin-binding Rho-activating protein n=1 Tax=Collichthys lucidus TaxID=240159 RepID=A0A4U5VIQ3_COLLU|nr:Actin-binding Rho-activating protein [Collichthys lucidus]